MPPKGLNWDDRYNTDKSIYVQETPPPPSAPSEFDRHPYCAELSGLPVLSDELMVPSISRAGSWATAVDNVPRRLLQLGRFGLCAGVLASRRQVWMGILNLSAMPVQYGIYKGKVPNDRKKPPNLMTSYRPVVAESLVTGHRF